MTILIIFFLISFIPVFWVNYIFKKNDTILFGRESSGVPKHVHEIVNERLRIPMLENKRSLNLATSVGIVLAEQLRQN